MNYLLIILLIGGLIFFHELGHFIAARLLGLPVARFSLGFGPKLWSFTRGRTEYRLSAVPLGGYVLPDIKTEQEYFDTPVWKRICLSLGGPAANMVLALPLLALLNILVRGMSLEAAFVAPLAQAGDMVVAILAVIPQLFAKPDQIAGVVGIVSQGGKAVGLELTRALHFSAFLSVNLAIFNMLPIPILDGGKIVMALLEKIHPSTRRVFVPLSLAGAFLLGGLLIFATAADIVRLAGG